MPARIQLRSFSFKESESPWFDLIPYACRTQICIDCRKDKSDARSKHATGVMQRVQAWLLSTAGKNERNKKKSPGDGALDGSAAEKEGVSFESHPTTSPRRSWLRRRRRSTPRPPAHAASWCEQGEGVDSVRRTRNRTAARGRA